MCGGSWCAGSLPAPRVKNRQACRGEFRVTKSRELPRSSTFQGKMCCMAPELAHALTTADPAQLGARIKAARVAAGLTQPQLAGTDASVAFLSRIETGQRRPS